MLTQSEHEGRANGTQFAEALVGQKHAGANESTLLSSEETRNQPVSIGGVYDLKFPAISRTSAVNQ